MRGRERLGRVAAGLAFAVLAGLALGCRREGDRRATDVAEQPSRNAAAGSGERFARDSAVAFAREFYAWYAPRVQDARESAASLVLRERPSALASDLRDALIADEARRAHSDGEIVSLDYDPFTNSQDPCARYDAGEATRAGNGFRVRIFAVCDGVRQANASLTAEVVRVENGWAFANFHDESDGKDVRHTLRQLADTVTK